MERFAVLKTAVETAELIDAHAHNIVALSSSFPFVNCFTEATGDALSYAPHTINFKRSLKEIAELYGVESSLHAIEEYRSSSGVETITAKCLKAAKISAVFIDDGLELDKMHEIEWHKTFVPYVGRILRIEHLAEKILEEGGPGGKRWTLASFTEIFVGKLKSHAENIVGFKSIVAYCSGLEINTNVSHKDAEEGLNDVLRGKERALLVPNHRSDIDWLVGMVLAERSGCLGSSLALIKKSAMFLPVVGWSMWFSGYIFLDRNWSKDQNTMNSGFEGLQDIPLPYWLALFVEGTRFTQAKLVAAQEFAASAGLPIPRNVLVPRTKGFVTAVTHLRSHQPPPVIYNIAVAIPRNEPQPTLLRMFRGRSSVVHVHLERHLMEELPETSSEIAQWCRDMFVAKDELLDKHFEMDTFGDKLRHDIGRPKKSLLVVTLWSCALIFGTIEFFEMCTFSWGEIAFLALFLTIVTILMQILIVFSQSERSNPPNVSSQPDPLNQALLKA